MQHARCIQRASASLVFGSRASAPAGRTLAACSNHVRFRPSPLATQVSSPYSASFTVVARCFTTQPGSFRVRSSVLSQVSQRRRLQSTPRSKQDQAVTPSSQQKDEKKSRLAEEEEDDTDEGQAFKKSSKASAAAQINLAARLSKDGSSGSGQQAGWQEVVRLLRIARPEVKPLAVAVTFLLISSSISMSLPFSIGKILDVAAKPPGEVHELFGLSMNTFYLGLGGLLTIGACANFGRIIVLRIVGERVVTRLRSRLFRQTVIQDAEFFDANRVGDLISRLGSDTIIVGKSITQNVSDGLRSLVSATAGFTLMGYMSLKLTGILALLFPPVAIGAFFYGRAIRTLSRRIQRALGSLTKIAEERLGNVRTSQAFAGEIQEVHRYNTQVRKIFDLGKREAYISAIFFSSSGFMGNMTFLTLLWFGGGMVSSGQISVGDLTSFLMYTAYAGSSLFGLSGFYSELMKGVGAASRLFELQDREPTISPTKGLAVRSARGDIEFNNVTFSYPTRPAVEIFKDLDFTIKQGTNIAIVAPSGAGKSTVASLIMRFYQPTAGKITIAGNDISKMNAKQLRRKIGYVGQEPVLFSGSIAENIAYGEINATQQEIVAAARKANCEFISDFPDGLDTQVGSRGTQLSGGQKQRIAIARALLKDPDILILDEATSALDAESETLVNQALGTLLASHNTTISIAHRLSTIQRSDRIICIGADGKVAEQGTYKELTAREGAFRRLMEWQMSGEQPKRSNNARVTEEEELAYKAESDVEEPHEEDAADQETEKQPEEKVVEKASEKVDEPRKGD